jgi:ribosomal protein S12 methylthiotransferase
VLREAERLVAAGVKELLVISQDTSAYGTDWKGRDEKFPILDLSTAFSTRSALGSLALCLPLPACARADPLMADGQRCCPISTSRSSTPIPTRSNAWPGPRRPKARSTRSAAWRDDCPDITLRSTFIVGYPGETEAEFQTLLDWMDEAQLDRVGCFKYENVAGARSNALPDHVPEEVKEERWHRFMEKAQAISEAKLAAKVGQRRQVIVDEVDAEAATCRTTADAPEIDGNLFIDEGFEGLAPGDLVEVEVDEAGEYDLWGRLVAAKCRAPARDRLWTSDDPRHDHLRHDGDGARCSPGRRSRRALRPAPTSRRGSSACFTGKGAIAEETEVSVTFKTTEARDRRWSH